MSFNLDSARLPTEYPIKDAIAIYIKRLGTYLIVAVISLVVLGSLLFYPITSLIVIGSIVLLFVLLIGIVVSILLFYSFGSASLFTAKLAFRLFADLLEISITVNPSKKQTNISKDDSTALADKINK